MDNADFWPREVRVRPWRGTAGGNSAAPPPSTSLAISGPSKVLSTVEQRIAADVEDVIATASRELNDRPGSVSTAPVSTLTPPEVEVGGENFVNAAEFMEVPDNQENFSA